MFSVLTKFDKYVKPKVGGVVPELSSLTAPLHYKVTFVFLLVVSVLASTYSYIDSSDKPIQCLLEKGIKIEKDVINRYCWVMSTFTLPSKYKGMAGTDYIYPGVGPDDETHEKEYHAYYQWVPLVLAFQAIMFYTPHFLWKVIEGGRMKRTVLGLNSDIKEYNDIGEKLVKLRDELKKLLEKDDDENLQENIEVLRENIKEVSFCRKTKADQFSQFLYNHAIHKVGLFAWTTLTYVYEALNLFHVILQIFIVNWFLDGEFLQFGTKVVQFSFEDQEDRMDPMSRVFPKMSTCHIGKIGASGTIEHFGALCVLSMNVINEKAFIFLWFWFIILSIFTALGLAWKIYRKFSPDYTSSENHLKKFAINFDRKMRIQFNTLQRKLPLPTWLILIYLAESIKFQHDTEILLTSLSEMFNIEVSSTEDIFQKSSSRKGDIPLKTISHP